MNDQMWSYLRRGKRAIPGWLLRTDAEIIGTILDHQAEQRLLGSCVEIGVHHGKSFIPLCLALRPDELALAIDIFDDQQKNLDASGRGDLSKFRANLSRHGIPDSNVKVLKCSSESVTADQILREVGRARFFSIDGGHWEAIVANDLRLAESTLALGGVIALDDFFRAEWPDVTSGYYRWLANTQSALTPFAIGPNKLYLTHREFTSAYRAALATNYLNQFLSKTYHSTSFDVDCFRVELARQDEDTLRAMVSNALKIFRPSAWITLKRIANRGG